MDLYILNEIQKLKQGGVGSAGAASDPMGFETHPVDTTVDGWVSFYAVNWRSHNSNANWTSTGPAGSLFYAYGNSDPNTGRFGVWNSKGYVSNTGTMNVSHDNIAYRHMAHSVRDTIGYGTQLHTSNTTASYHPIGTNVMFIRNPTDTAITTSLNWYHTNGWSSGYEGSSVWTFTPNGDYQTTTGGSWVQAFTKTSGESFYTATINFTVPANKTIILVGVCSSYNWTSSYQAALMQNYNMFYGINALEAQGLVCDHSMSQTYQQYGDTNTFQNKWNSDAGIAAFYNNAAAYFGNR